MVAWKGRRTPLRARARARVPLRSGGRENIVCLVVRCLWLLLFIVVVVYLRTAGGGRYVRTDA